jgi:hypothetical protein
MEDFSRPSLVDRRSVRLELKPYLRDHVFEGRMIFPAVEILIALARAVRSRFPRDHVKMMASAHFKKLLVFDSDARFLEVQIETRPEVRGIAATLYSSFASKSALVRRTVENAAVIFDQSSQIPSPSLTFSTAKSLGAGCIQLSADSIYRGLVPFGPAFQNMVGDLSMSEEGTVVEIDGGAAEGDETLLGSPFPFDAAMHAACVWGQRFCGVVALPVGFDSRTIYRPTRSGCRYVARIVPVDVSREPFTFHAWIFDADGVIYEEVLGLKMRDVTGGRRKPPDWIREGVCRKSF